MEVYLSVIVPAYNEEANIACTLNSILEYLRGKPFAWEVVVVDDGSLDRTAEMVRGFPVKLLTSERNCGKGVAVRRGMLAAQGQFRLFTDADNSTSISEIEKLLPFAEEGWDIVIGTRRMRESTIEVVPPFHRHLLGEIYVSVSRLLTGVEVSDFNCGFKLFTARAAESLFSVQRMERWSFDVEVLFLAARCGFTIKEVPVRWAHVQSTSKVRPLSDGIRSLKDLLRIRYNYAVGRYKVRERSAE